MKAPSGAEVPVTANYALAEQAAPGQHDTGSRYVEFLPEDAVFVVSINRSYPRLGAYEAARYAWRISAARAKDIELVLATKDRRVVGVFRPREWKPATMENFPGYEREMPGRIGFVGEEAKPSVASRYLGRELPPGFRFSGNGYRYAGKLDA